MLRRLGVPGGSCVLGNGVDLGRFDPARRRTGAPRVRSAPSSGSDPTASCAVPSVGSSGRRATGSSSPPRSVARTRVPELKFVIVGPSRARQERRGAREELERVAAPRRTSRSSGCATTSTSSTRPWICSCSLRTARGFPEPRWRPRRWVCRSSSPTSAVAVRSSITAATASGSCPRRRRAGRHDRRPSRDDPIDGPGWGPPRSRRPAPTSISDGSSTSRLTCYARLLADDAMGTGRTGLSGRSTNVSPVCLTVDVEDFYEGMHTLAYDVEPPTGPSPVSTRLRRLLECRDCADHLVRRRTPRRQVRRRACGTRRGRSRDRLARPDHGRLPGPGAALATWLRSGRTMVEDVVQRPVTGFRSPRFDLPVGLDVTGSVTRSKPRASPTSPTPTGA